MEFDVRFYLVAILFIIFDLEIAFLFPWAISLGNIGTLGFWSMMIFLFISMGYIFRKSWLIGILVNDDFFISINHRFYIRMENRSAGLGLK